MGRNIWALGSSTVSNVSHGEHIHGGHGRGGHVDLVCLLQRNDKASYTILLRIPSPHGPDSITLCLVCHDTQSFCAFPLKIAQLSYKIIKILKTIPIGICMIFMISDHRHDHQSGQHKPLSTCLAKPWS